MTKVLITGGAGFIGSNYIEYALEKHPDWQITNLDKLTYAGFKENVEPFEANFPSRYRFVWGDVCNPWMLEPLVKSHDLIIHFAAESNVDISIHNAFQFLDTNITGTKVLLDACCKYGIDRVLVVSTDEVYGNAWQDRPSLETDPLMPCSPYAASKSAQDVLAFSYYETYKLPVVRTRCSNNYGPRQDPTKLIPRFLLHALHDQKVPIYGHGKNTRDWIHTQDHARAISAVLLSPEKYNGEVFNVGADCEKNVLEICSLIFKALNKDDSLLSFVEDRLGHVRRHAVNSSKIEQELNWKPEVSFEEGIQQTIQWYQSHSDWWKSIIESQSERLPNYDKTYGFRNWI